LCIKKSIVYIFQCIDIVCDGSMNHWEMENAVDLGAALKEAGFEVSQICCSRPSCFDFAARKAENVVLVKFRSDMDTFSSSESRDLRVVSGCVSAASLLVSQRAHEKPLEEDTVYSRYAVFAVARKTFENIALRGAHPLIHAAPGGYCVEIYGELAKKKRQEMGLSIGKLAEMVGVSRRTLYGYERGMAKASVASAYNLARTLGIPVAKPINIFEKTRKQSQCLLTKAKHAIVGNVLLQKVFRKFPRWDVTAVRRAPFDFVINVPPEEEVIVGGVAMNGEQELDKRVDEILSVSRVVEAHPVLITEKQKPSSRDIFCICRNEFSRIRTPEDLMENL
jgi:putative transcriptional regulator